ncbi:MAG: hypothetical protein KJO07_11425, partial [Deltaproteobacteria bacterium]|nr:hypothetical protein [Deltaproteobacteria bacterium]
MPLAFAIAGLVACGGDSPPGSDDRCIPQCNDHCDGRGDSCGGSCTSCPAGQGCAQGACSVCESNDACGAECSDCSAQASNRWCVDRQRCGCQLDSDCAEGEVCDGGSCRACEADACVRSELYPGGWSPGYTAPGGEFLHDFSYAGYRLGEGELPQPSGSEASVLDHGADASGSSDSRGAFQAAIDAVAASGGTVVVPAGDYRIDGGLLVTSSNTVIKGAGVDKSKVFFTTHGGEWADRGHLAFRGTIAIEGDSQLIADAEALTTELEVADASLFEVGDDVAIGWILSEGFLLEHGMENHWDHSLDLYKVFFRRQVVAVQPPNRIVVDVPMRYPALMRDSASVRLERGFLREVGVQGLSLSNAAPSVEDAEAVSKTKLVHFRGVKDAWVRDLSSYQSPLAGGDCGRDDDQDRGCHLQSRGIEVEESARVTIRDTVLERAQHLGAGGNGYLFVVRYSDEVLVDSCVGTRGRHNFITDGDFSSSGVVFRNNR